MASYCMISQLLHGCHNVTMQAGMHAQMPLGMVWSEHDSHASTHERDEACQHSTCAEDDDGILPSNLPYRHVFESNQAVTMCCFFMHTCIPSVIAEVENRRACTHTHTHTHETHGDVVN
jgi:hypothetical protein